MIKFPPIRGSMRRLPSVGKLMSAHIESIYYMQEIVRKLVRQSRSLTLTFDMSAVAMDHISYVHVYERRDGF